MAKTAYQDALSDSSPAPGRTRSEDTSSCRQAARHLAPESSSGRHARQFVQDSLENWGWPGSAAFQDLQDILLLTSELAINAAHHAHSEMDVTVRYWPGAMVRIEVHDEGAGMPRVHQPTTFEESGRGLALVELLSERWGVSFAPPGKTVWFQLRLRYRSSRAADPPTRLSCPSG